MIFFFCFIIKVIINKITEKIKRHIKSSLNNEFFKINDEKKYEQIVKSCVNNVLKYESNEQFFERNIDKKNKREIIHNSIQLPKTIPKR